MIIVLLGGLLLVVVVVVVMVATRRTLVVTGFIAFSTRMFMMMMMRNDGWSWSVVITRCSSNHRRSCNKSHEESQLHVIRLELKFWIEEFSG
jgi:hypothetical protein